MYRKICFILVVLMMTGCVEQNIKNTQSSLTHSNSALAQLERDAEQEDCGVASLDCVEEEPQSESSTNQSSSPPPIANQTPEPDDQGQYYGIPIRAEQQNIMFVLDISGSMEGTNEATTESMLKSLALGALSRNKDTRLLSGLLGVSVLAKKTKLDDAKKELITAITDLETGTRFNIVTFGGSTRVWQSDLIQASFLNKSTAKSFVNSLKSGGGTPAMAALQKAFDFSEADTIFFVSDGNPNSSTHSIIKKTHRMNASRKVKINTIGLGSDQNAKFMQQLAYENKGSYVRR